MVAKTRTLGERKLIIQFQHSNHQIARNPIVTPSNKKKANRPGRSPRQLDKPDGHLLSHLSASILQDPVFHLLTPELQKLAKESNIIAKRITRRKTKSWAKFVHKCGGEEVLRNAYYLDGVDGLRQIISACYPKNDGKMDLDSGFDAWASGPYDLDKRDPISPYCIDGYVDSWTVPCSTCTRKGEIPKEPFFRWFNEKPPMYSCDGRFRFFAGFIGGEYKQFWTDSDEEYWADKNIKKEPRIELEKYGGIVEQGPVALTEHGQKEFLEWFNVKFEEKWGPEEVKVKHPGSPPWQSEGSDPNEHTKWKKKMLAWQAYKTREKMRAKKKQQVLKPTMIKCEYSSASSDGDD